MDTTDIILHEETAEVTENTNVVQFPSKEAREIRAQNLPLRINISDLDFSSLSSPDINRITLPEGFEMQTIRPEDYKTNEDYLRRINIENLCNVAAMEIYFKLLSMGYSVQTQEFAKDLEFAQEALHSAILRTFGEEHPIQDYVDENFELVTVQTTTKELDPT